MTSGYSSLLLPGLAIAAADDFLDREVIVVALPVLDLVAAVAVLERHAVDEADLAADHLAALQVGDVDPFDDARRLGERRALPAARPRLPSGW